MFSVMKYWLVMWREWIYMPTSRQMYLINVCNKNSLVNCIPYSNSLLAIYMLNFIVYYVCVNAGKPP